MKTREISEMLKVLRTGEDRLTDAEIDNLEKMVRQAKEDPLTGLRNRRSFEEDLKKECARAARESKAFGIYMIDVNNFKDFNDRFGHSGGDSILRYIGECLEQSVRAADTIYRYGGDEFTALVIGLEYQDSSSTVSNIGKRMNSTIQRGPVAFNDRCFHYAEVSIGAKVCIPKDGKYDLEGSIREADQHMYIAKGMKAAGSAISITSDRIPRRATREMYAIGKIPLK